MYWLKIVWTVWCLSPIILSLFYMIYYFRSKEISDVIAGLSGIVGYLFSLGVIAVASHSSTSAIVLVYILKFIMPLFILLLIERVQEQEWYEAKNTVWALLGFLGMVLFINFTDLIFK